MITKQPMTAQERRSVAALALLYSIRMLGLFMVLPLLAVYSASLPGATPAMIGLALGVYGLSQALLQIPFGWLSDRVGRKPVIVGGLFLFVIGSIVAATADSIVAVIVGRLLQGSGAIASTVMALVADLTSVEQRTKAMALVGMSIGVSFALAMVLGPVLAGWGGLGSVFWASAGLGLLGVAIVLGLLPKPQASVSPASDSVSADTLTQAGLLRRAIKDGRLLRLNIGVFTLHFVLMSAFLLVPVALEAVAGVPREAHWRVYLPVLLLSIVGMIPLMSLGERYQQPQCAFLIAIAIVMLGVGLQGFTSSAWLLYVGLTVFFVGFNYLEASLPSLVSKTVFAGGRGTAMGVYSTCQFLGAFSGGAAGGWVQQHVGSHALVLMSMILVMAWWLLQRSAGELLPVAPVEVPQA